MIGSDVATSAIVKKSSIPPKIRPKILRKITARWPPTPSPPPFPDRSAILKRYSKDTQKILQRYSKDTPKILGLRTTEESQTFLEIITIANLTRSLSSPQKILKDTRKILKRYSKLLGLGVAKELKTSLKCITNSTQNSIAP